MLTLLIFVLFIVLMLGLVTRMARASRQRAYEAEHRQLEELGQDGGEQVSPLGMFPFGGILEEMMRGMETRSYRIDPDTGEWVDITDEQPPVPEPAPAAEPSRAKRRSRTRPKSRSSMSPFGMLGGMGMPSDGSGEFEVEPPEELSTFDDVGGMEKLKQEVRDTRRLDARASGGRRAVRDRLERDPAARAARRRQDVLRPGDRRRVRHEPDPRLHRRPRRVRSSAALRATSTRRSRPRSRICPACCSSTSSTRSRSAATTPPIRSPAGRSTSC